MPVRPDIIMLNINEIPKMSNLPTPALSFVPLPPTPLYLDGAKSAT